MRLFFEVMLKEREREVNTRLQLHRLGPRAGGLLIRDLQHQQQQLCIAQQLQSGIVACGVHDSCLIGPSHTALQASNNSRANLTQLSIPQTTHFNQTLLCHK